MTKTASIRMIKGSAMIVGAMISAAVMTILYDWVVNKYGHETRFQIIFGVGGTIIGVTTIAFALMTYTNNFGAGFKKLEENTK